MAVVRGDRAEWNSTADATKTVLTAKAPAALHSRDSLRSSLRCGACFVGVHAEPRPLSVPPRGSG